jgi:hypothetical protein
MKSHGMTNKIVQSNFKGQLFYREYFMLNMHTATYTLQLLS